MFRNKYTKVLGGTISGDVVMITLFSSFFPKFFTGVYLCCRSYLTLKSKFGDRGMV